jgi:hypothetical protein
MGKPLCKDPAGGHHEIVKASEVSARSGLQQEFKILVLVKEGSPRSLSERLTHVRIERLCDIEVNALA